MIKDILRFKSGILLDIQFPIKLCDKNGNVIYQENSDGYWSKSEYDKNGKEIRFENSDGYWSKSEHDENGNVTYYENSDGDKNGA